jgi:hypothetical protein
MANAERRTTMKILLTSVSLAVVALSFAAPAYAQTPPTPEGTYTEQLTRSDGKILFNPGIVVAWNCGPDCFSMGNYQYRYDPASSRWQTAPDPSNGTCQDGSSRSASSVWWTTDGENFTGDWVMPDPCPEGVPASRKSVLMPA